MVRALVFSALAALVLGACAEDKTVARTELMLVADTDIDDLERIEFSVSGTDRDAEVASAPLRPDGRPLTLAIVRDEGPLGPVYVSAAGYRSNSKVIERTAVVSFVRGETLVVPLHLVRACEAVSCAADETCTEQSCRPVSIDVSALQTWQGSAPKLDAMRSGIDAGAPPQDAATPLDELDADLALDANTSLDAELADGAARDGSADATSDANLADASAPDAAIQNCPPAGSVDTATNRNHCGMCGRVCKPMEYCWAGVCTK